MKALRESKDLGPFLFTGQLTRLVSKTQFPYRYGDNNACFPYVPRACDEHRNVGVGDMHMHKDCAFTAGSEVRSLSLSPSSAAYWLWGLGQTAFVSGPHFSHLFNGGDGSTCF